MSDLSQINPLGENDNLVLTLGPDAAVVLRILRKQIQEVLYSPAKNISGFNGANASQWVQLAAGNSNMPTLANTNANQSVVGQQLAFQAVSGVQDIFQVGTLKSLWQVWYGIAPSYLRTWIRQPRGGQYVNALDQNLWPLSQSGQVMDTSYIDGFASPLGRPVQETEFFLAMNISVDFSLLNPMTRSINPSLNFVINRMKVAPVRGYDKIKRILKGQIPARWATIGNPDIDLSSLWAAGAYDGAQPVPLTSVDPDSSKFSQTLANAGYLDVENPQQPGGA